VHELSITQSIVEICAEQAGSARVTRVTLEIGDLAAIAPDALRFCFELCTQETALQGAQLEIVDVPGLELKIRQMEVI
jgi:hydrogenase nickel incorporation protein HypA/HybF